MSVLESCLLLVLVSSSGNCLCVGSLVPDELVVHLSLFFCVLRMRPPPGGGSFPSEDSGHCPSGAPEDSDLEAFLDLVGNPVGAGSC